MSENITIESNEESQKTTSGDLHHKQSNQEETTEDNCRFTDGQIIRLVRVRFPGHAKSYPFLVGKRALTYGQKVMAMSDRGMAVGYINSFVYEIPFKKSLLPLKTINKVATEQDIEKEKENYKRQKEIETTCQNLIEKHKLDMNLTHVEFTQFGKKVVFYFTAPARVDFRGLVKDLVTELKLRIELRQISVRDRAASMGALGPCGGELCCSSFLSRYGNVSIKMAKNQNLTLNYSRLNGVCGQLKCCLQYEDEVYSHKRHKLPPEHKIIKAKNGDIGKVTRIHILSEQFDLFTSRGQIRRYTANQFDKVLTDFKMPHDFKNILDETSKIIGLEETQSQKEHELNRDMEKIKRRSFTYAIDNFNSFEDLAKSPLREGVEKERELIQKQKEAKLNTPANPEPSFKQEAKKDSHIEKKDISHAPSDTQDDSSKKTEDKGQKEGRNNNRRPHNKRRFNNKNRNRNRNRNSNAKGKPSPQGKE